MTPQALNRPVALFSLALVSLAAAGCKLSFIFLPPLIEVGQTYEFVFQLSNADETGFQSLSARVPSGWTVTSSTYEQSTSPPASGDLTFTEDDFCFDEPSPAGYQTLRFSRNPAAPTVLGDSAVARLEFQIDSTPLVPYHAWFVLSGISVNGAGCSDPISATWGGELIFGDGFETGDLSLWSASQSLD